MNNQCQSRSERLEAAKELLDNLVHDFNNSIAQVAGYLSLASEELKPEHPCTQYLHKMSSGLERIQHLLQAVLEATHPERNSAPSPTDFTALLKSEAESWAQALPSSEKLSVELRLAPCTLCLDERLWRKLIRCLLDNAQEALEPGGQVCIQLHALPVPAVACADSRFFWELVLQDAGSGMSEDVLKRACDPLFTTHAHGPASGLGLTFVHSMVGLQGGELRLESAPGEGTRVKILLPAG